jgi:hypothetical protein
MTQKPEDENFDVFLTHLKDQQDAAVEQASIFVDRIDELTSVIRGEENQKFTTDNFGETYVGQKFKWVTSLEEFSKASVRICPHVSFESPSTYYVNVWAPEAIGCAECIHKKAKLFNEAYPDNCDFCYQKVEIFIESLFQIGPFIIVGNLCQFCYDKQYAESKHS